MATIRLVIEIDATRAAHANALAERISNFADVEFEDETMRCGRSMSLRSWIAKPGPHGKYEEP